MIATDGAAGPLRDGAPTLVEVLHPHWASSLSLDPGSRRACLLLNNTAATYTLDGDDLELAWDAFPVERFRLKDGRYVHLDMIDARDPGGPLKAAPFVAAEVPNSTYVAELRTSGSDIAVYTQVFIHNEYATKHLPETASVVVDLGANVGLATLFFAARYPGASLYSVEPDPENFALLSRNVAQLGSRSSVVQAAIWDEDKTLDIKRTDASGTPLGDWGVQVESGDAGSATSVAGWSMDRLIRHFALERIDILKIDIEGAEKELFEAANLDWLGIVDMVLIETHERFKPGCNAAVLKLLDLGFRLMPRSGENEVLVKARNGATAAVPRHQARKPVIVTAYYKEDSETLRRCLKSVQDQDTAVDHILVADGHPLDWIDAMPVRHIKLDRAHGDYGNTPRGVGALLAISEGYDGIGFLDADNWLETNHVSSCIAAEAANPDADFVIARWNLRRPNGSVLPSAHDPSHVDTNCFFFLAGSFHMLPHFSMMHKELSLIGDRVFYKAVNGAQLKSAVVAHPTVNYTCLWPLMYKMAGEEPPVGAKRDITTAHIADWLKTQNPRDLEIISRRAGVRFT